MEGFTVTIKTNAIDAKNFFDKARRDQIPYAMSRTVNRLAWDIRDREQGDLGKYFDLRTNWLTKRGAMPVLQSNKRQLPDIHSILGVKDEVAALNITGGTRRAKSGKMAVPFSDAGGGQSARSIINPGKETLPKSKWPSAIVKTKKSATTRRRGRGGLKPKPFYLTSAQSGRRYVAIRTGAGRFPLNVLYGFDSSIKVPKQWPLDDKAEGYIVKKYDLFLEEEISRALHSPRRF